MGNKDYHLNDGKKEENSKMADWLEEALEKIDGLETKGVRKNYNMSNSPNAGVKDKMPEWLEPVLDAKKSEVEANPFKGIKDPILNPSNEGLEKKKCSVCGCILSSNEVGTCSKCK